MSLNDMSAQPGAIKAGFYKLWRKFRNAYSTTAMKTGSVWSDGSEIYRKVISCGALPNATTKNTAHGITGLGTVVSLRGMADNGTIQHCLPRAEGVVQAVDEGGVATYTVTADCVELYATDTNIVMKSVTDLSTFTASFVVIEYTLA